MWKILCQVKSFLFRALGFLLWGRSVLQPLIFQFDALVETSSFFRPEVPFTLSFLAPPNDDFADEISSFWLLGQTERGKVELHESIHLMMALHQQWRAVNRKNHEIPLNLKERSRLNWLWSKFFYFSGTELLRGVSDSCCIRLRRI